MADGKIPTPPVAIEGNRDVPRAATPAQRRPILRATTSGMHIENGLKIIEKENYRGSTEHTIGSTIRQPSASSSVRPASHPTSQGTSQNAEFRNMFDAERAIRRSTARSEREAAQAQEQDELRLKVSQKRRKKLATERWKLALHSIQKDRAKQAIKTHENHTKNEDRSFTEGQIRQHAPAPTPPDRRRRSYFRRQSSSSLRSREFPTPSRSYSTELFDTTRETTNLSDTRTPTRRPSAIFDEPEDAPKPSAELLRKLNHIAVGKIAENQGIPRDCAIEVISTLLRTIFYETPVGTRLVSLYRPGSVNAPQEVVQHKVADELGFDLSLFGRIPDLARYLLEQDISQPTGQSEPDPAHTSQNQLKSGQKPKKPIRPLEQKFSIKRVNFLARKITTIAQGLNLSATTCNTKQIAIESLVAWADYKLDFNREKISCSEKIVALDRSQSNVIFSQTIEDSLRRAIRRVSGPATDNALKIKEKTSRSQVKKHLRAMLASAKQITSIVKKTHEKISSSSDRSTRILNRITRGRYNPFHAKVKEIKSAFKREVYTKSHPGEVRKKNEKYARKGVIKFKLTRGKRARYTAKALLDEVGKSAIDYADKICDVGINSGQSNELIGIVSLLKKNITSAMENVRTNEQVLFLTEFFDKIGVSKDDIAKLLLVYSIDLDTIEKRCIELIRQVNLTQDLASFNPWFESKKIEEGGHVAELISQKVKLTQYFKNAVWKYATSNPKTRDRPEKLAKLYQQYQEAMGEQLILSEHGAKINTLESLLDKVNGTVISYQYILQEKNDILLETLAQKSDILHVHTLEDPQTLYILGSFQERFNLYPESVARVLGEKLGGPKSFNHLENTLYRYSSYAPSSARDMSVQGTDEILILPETSPEPSELSLSTATNQRTLSLEPSAQDYIKQGARPKVYAPSTNPVAHPSSAISRKPPPEPGSPFLNQSVPETPDLPSQHTPDKPTASSMKVPPAPDTKITPTNPAQANIALKSSMSTRLSKSPPPTEKRPPRSNGVCGPSIPTGGFKIGNQGR